MSRLLQSAILAGATLMAGPFVPEASAGHEVSLGKVTVGIGGGGLRVSIGRRCPPPVHYHSWQYSTRRVWVAPSYRMTTVGFDHCGRPIRRQVMVRAGHWKFVQVRQCCCGVVQDC